MSRQKTRKLLLFISFMLFPLIFLHFSPAIIIEAALEGMINGSFIVFIAMFIGSIFFGRVFCAYMCPGGGLQECAFTVNDKHPKQGRKNYIKYGIWVLWIIAIILSFLHNGQILGINFFWGDSWGGIARIFRGASPGFNIAFNFSLFYTVVSVIFLFALFGGKRAFCHYFCWMAPFMVLGIKLRNLLHLPSLYVGFEKSIECVSCKKCNNSCPMCIDIENIVKSGEDSGSIESLECIQCGACADNCPKNILKYKFGKISKKFKA